MTLGGVARHVKELCSQIVFAWRICPNRTDALRLVWRTAAFHVANRTGFRLCSEAPFRIQLGLSTLSTDIWLRPFEGDLFVFYEVLKDEVYAVPGEMQAPEQVRFILDLGANVGLAAIYLANRYPEARIVAVEPAPANADLLRRNTAAIGRISAVEACVSDSDGTRMLEVSGPAWGIAVGKGQKGVEVRAMTIPTLLCGLGVPWIDLLKVDLEGEEEVVFASGDFLEHVGKVLIELHGQYGPERFRADFSPHGFEVFPIGSLPGVQIVLATRATSMPAGV